MVSVQLAAIDWSNLLSAFVGAVIGGIFTIWGAYAGATRSHRDQIARDHAEDEERRQNVLRAILAEFEALMAIYSAGTGEKLEMAKLYHEHYFIMTGDYFPVYRGNGTQLGGLPPNLSRKIIVLYSYVNNLLIEELRINNGYLERGRFPPGDMTLAAHLPILKALHFALKQSFVEVQREARIYLKMEIPDDPLRTVDIRFPSTVQKLGAEA